VTLAGADLDPVIHVPARLRIMVALATLPEPDSLSFSRLQRLLGLTAGNLITHLRKLAEAGYITTAKAPRQGTAVSLTHAGRTALERYSATLRELLDQAVDPPAARPDSGSAGALLVSCPERDRQLRGRTPRHARVT
jgi:DNA-binding MarR family transcriptional regulator